jgi:hypothetical protein
MPRNRTPVSVAKAVFRGALRNRRPARGEECYVSDRGVTLIETMIAVLVALIGVFSVGSVIFQATSTGDNQGKETTRATVYAQDKMEKLLSLGVAQTNPVSPPDFLSCTLPSASQPSQCNTTGISATSWTQGLLAGGTIDPPAPTACSAGTPGYVDFLDQNGVQLTGSSCSDVTAHFSYVRMWQITDLTAFAGGPAMKQVTVAVYALDAVSKTGGQPIVVLTSVISNPD